MSEPCGHESIPSGLDDAGALRAMREQAALAPLDDRSLLEVRGEDRRSFLQGMVSNDVSRLAPGEGVQALQLTEQGKVVADLRVLALEDAFLLDVPAGGRDQARSALERLIVADDVELAELPAVALAVRGPRALGILAAVSGVPELETLPEGGHREIEIDGARVRAVRLGEAGADGMILWCDPPSQRDAVARALGRAGVAAVEPRQVEILRVLAGRPRWGVDFDAQTLAPEVPPLGGAISYRKGCYLGQEVVERVAARGHVNRSLVSLELSGEAAPAAGSLVVDPATGAEIGRITSATIEPGTTTGVALAMVRRAAGAGGTEVVVRDATGASWPARVRELPGASR